MRNWTRIGATALGASVLLVPATALASTASGSPAHGSARPGPPPHPGQASTLVLSLPRERTSTSRATSIALVRLADTEQLL